MEDNTNQVLAQEKDESFVINDNVSENQKNQILLLNLRHLGVNLSNLSIVCTFFIALLFLGQILSVFVGFIVAVFLFCFLIIVTIATLGIIYFTTDFGKLWGWFGAITSGGATFIEFLQKLLVCVPYVSSLGVLAGVGAIISFSYCKKYKSASRIVVSSIMTALCVIMFILYLAGAGVSE